MAEAPITDVATLQKAFDSVAIDGKLKVATEVKNAISATGQDPMDFVARVLTKRFDWDNSGKIEKDEFVKMYQTIVTKPPSEKQIEGWFCMYNNDKDTAIDLSELSKLLKSLSKWGMDNEAMMTAILIEHFDKDNSQTIDFAEFRKVYHEVTYTSKDVLKNAFDSAAVDGKLGDAEHLKKAISKTGQDPIDFVAYALQIKYDADGSGKLEKSEFVSMYQKIAKDPLSAAQIGGWFILYNKDRDDAIDISELGKLLKDIAKYGQDNEALISNVLIQQFDINNDKSIDFDEFKRGYTEVMSFKKSMKK